MSFWKGNELYQEKADTFIRKPIEDCQLFNKTIFPVKRVIGIFGRDGSDKRTSVVDLLNQLGGGVLVVEVDVRYGETSSAIEQMDGFTSLRKQIVSQVEPTSSGDPATAALVVDHADILAYEPDNEKTMRFMLKLQSLAEETEILVILLFDRLLTDPDTVMPTKHYRNVLAKSIDVCLYVGAPHAEFRLQLLQEQIDAHIANAPFIQNVLSEGDYTMLVDHTAGATPRQIREFVRRVFDDLTSNYPSVYCRPFGAPADAPPQLNMAVLQSHMSNATGKLLILPVDGTKVEAVFEEAITRSSGTPVGKPVRGGVVEPTPPVVDEKKKKRSRMIKEEEEEEEKN